jgi:HEPN domain-containing protein
MRRRDDPEVADWLAHAAADAQTATLVAPHGLHAIVGFHCQQEAEKLLKALLVAQGVAVPRIHHLPTLLGQCRSAGIALSDIDDPCHWLTPHAAVSRYPGHGDLTAANAQEALAHAAAVRAAVDAVFAAAE